MINETHRQDKAAVAEDLSLRLTADCYGYFSGQYTFAIHPLNTPLQYNISIHLFISSSRYTFSIHSRNIPSRYTPLNASTLDIAITTSSNSFLLPPSRLHNHHSPSLLFSSPLPAGDRYSYEATKILDRLQQELNRSLSPEAPQVAQQVGGWVK